MESKTDNKYYYKQITKSMVSIIGCVYLVRFNDTRTLGGFLGFLSTIMMFSWVIDYFKYKYNNRKI